MTISKRPLDIHVRPLEQADAVPEALALAQNRDKSSIAAKLLHNALLGAGHNLKLAGERMLRAGLIGAGRE